ncbi:MAG: hypothetical protein NTW21_27620 [Verrucomicrobia bacterium]|nr:hypothetical protein [Verrucomicrobiota bacterium]
MKAIFKFAVRKPWIHVVLALVLPIGAWATLILIAPKHPLRELEVSPASHHGSPSTANRHP